MLEYQHFESKHIKKTLYCCCSFQKSLFLAAIIILFFCFLAGYNGLYAANTDDSNKPVSADAAKIGFAEGAKTKILLIASESDHPYGTHMYMHECGLLAKCLKQNPGVDAVVIKGWPKDKGLIEQANSIVLYSGPGSDFILVNNSKEFQEQMEKGKGFACLHWATGVMYKEGDKQRAQKWLDYLGCIYDVNQSSVTTDYSMVIRFASDHEICKGWKDFLIYEEYYINMKTLDAVKPLIKANINGKEEVVGWSYLRPDGGRSYANTLGHFHYNFSNPSFLKMYLNGILWTAGYNIPQNGANCRIEPEDMVLTP